MLLFGVVLAIASLIGFANDHFIRFKGNAESLEDIARKSWQAIVSHL